MSKYNETIIWKGDEWKIVERDIWIDFVDGEGTIRLTMDWLELQSMVSELRPYFNFL